MSEALLATHCAGCGVKLQIEHAEQVGFVPVAARNKETVTCQRCFRIKNYNDATTVAIDQDDFLRLLGGIATTNSLVVHIVDLFDFEGSLIAGLQRFVGHNPVILVVNKIDLLPRGVNPNRLRNWVQRQAKAQGIKLIDVVLCSAKRGTGFDHVIDAVSEHRGERDVYVVGATNVGKSTLINRLIHDYSDLERELTTSRYPGTTLDKVHIPLDDGHEIIDTPGIVYKHRMTEIVPRNLLQTLLPEREIKPAVYQLNAGQTLFVGALARFDFVEGQRQSFTFYMSNGLKLHRTKLERADELYEQHQGELLAPPNKEQLSEMPTWTRHRFNVKKGFEGDIFISGLGWIRINSNTGALLDVHAPKGIRVLLREALI